MDLWHVINKVAESLGVKLATRQKWKVRGAVPSRWYFPLIDASGGALTKEQLLGLHETKKSKRTPAERDALKMVGGE